MESTLMSELHSDTYVWGDQVQSVYANWLVVQYLIALMVQVS